MSTHPSRTRVLADRGGVALVLVLWLMLVMGLLSLRVLGSARERVDSASHVRAELIGRYAAESGVIEARMAMEEIVRAASTPELQASLIDELGYRVEGGVRVLRSGRYQLAVEDLTGRVDLNRSPDGVVLGLLEQFVPGQSASALVSTLRPFGPEELAALQSSFGPGGGDSLLATDVPIRPVTRIEQLARIPGFGPELAAALAPYVTVWGDGPVNVNSAPLPVLAAIPGVGPTGALTLWEEREAGRRFSSPEEVDALLAETGAGGGTSVGVTTSPRRVLVVSRGWEDGQPMAHEVRAVFDVLTSRLVSGSRVRLRSWTERSR